MGSISLAGSQQNDRIMKMMKWTFTALFILASAAAFAQAYSITGSIQDETDNSSLIGVNVLLYAIGDSTQKTGAITDVDGGFTISNVAAGTYKLRASYIGFQNYERNVVVSGNVNLGAISLKASSTQLKGVEVAAQQIAAQQSGDTSSFNSGAYKTNRDASAEELVNKMPGISTEGGTVKAQGEDVRQVLVDGKPFFGDDANAALKNLPAEIIDKIQVFDKLSDQAQLTGIDDGNSQKTINIVTKPGRNNGQFGKVFAGYGTDGRYLGGGSVNYFKGDTRVSLIGLFNNVNQQNFSTDDLLGVVGTSSGQGRGGSQGGRPRGGGGPRGGASGGAPSGGGDYRGGGSDASSFLVGQQGGISTTNSAGLNYSDSWGTKIKVTGSYFFNSTKNEQNTSLVRNYFSQADSNLIYKEESRNSSTNTNHRVNLRLEYEMDSSNSFILTPRLSFQGNTSYRDLFGNARYPDSSFVSGTHNTNTSNNQGYNFSNNLLYRHKFAKRGRTISLNLGTTLNSRTGDGKLSSIDTSGTPLAVDVIGQHYDLNSSGYTLSGSLNYTEPLSSKSQLMISYSPSYNNTTSDRKSFTDSGSPIDSLSNEFDNDYITQRGGLNYRTNTAKSNFMAGVNYQYATLEGKETFPQRFTITKTFSNVLPMLMFNYRFTRTKNLRIMYRASTNPPSITQLQNVLDNTNPLLLRTGNADLKQDYQHTLTLRYGATNTSTSTSFFAFLFANYTQDYIGNATFQPQNDSVVAIPGGSTIDLNRGVQLSMPMNLNGYRAARAFLTYGMPIKPIKSNLNLNAGFNYNRTPALINSKQNLANNYTVNGGLVLSSNISENIDFTLAYTGNYNVVKNSIQSQSDNNYYYQTTSFRFNWLFLNGFVFNTTLNHNLYSGLAAGYNQSYVLWNAALGYKFLKDKSLDIRVSAYDLLNQNRAVNRTVTESYIEDGNTEVLQRYFMLNITYTLRRFAGAAAASPSADDNPQRRGRRQRGGGDGAMDR